MSKPIFSLIAPSIRKQFYDGFYKSVSKGNTIPFEIIFVGDNEPIKIMPDNFHYIYTKVKPAQCFEIAARQAKGEYLIPLPDDVSFVDNFLNNLYETILKYDRDKYFIGCKLFEDGKSLVEYQYLDYTIKDSPIIAYAPALRKDVWTELGGIDKRFVAGWADIDMQLRFRERGLEVVLSDCIVNEFATKDKAKRLFKLTGEQGKKLIDSFWRTSTGDISNKRLSPVQSFLDENILTKTQGESTGFGKKNRSKTWE